MIELEYKILKALAYFDIFSYPLLKDEILFYLDEVPKPEDFSSSLQSLLEAGIIYKFDGFFTLQNKFRLIERRKKDNAKAEILMPKAKRVANFLYLFPFVRGIGISGSLSKNVASENSDFDYFIITKTNRLWIASTLLGLFKKLSFIVGKQHWFCLNYYIDESCLEIPEKNIFTATELLTLMTPTGEETLRLFLKANNWVIEYYPNYRIKPVEPEKPSVFIILKRAIESIFSNSMGNNLDSWLMKKAVFRWKKKKDEGKLVDLQGSEIHLYLTDKHFCKHNPIYFQAKILAAYSSRLDAIKVAWVDAEKKNELNYIFSSN